MLSVTNSPILAARVARVHRDTAFEHRKQDSEFGVLWAQACERAVDLLEARAFQRALEGDLEPVYYMGVPVDYMRKFDTRLQIEMLRANRSDNSRPLVSKSTWRQGATCLFSPRNSATSCSVSIANGSWRIHLPAKRKRYLI
jgi:hypothetical protein